MSAGAHEQEPMYADARALCLRLLSGPLAGSGWRLDQPIAIGRGLGCQIRIDNPAVSRLQCEVSLADGAVLLQNRSDRRLLRVNGLECDSCELHLGDVIEIGETAIVVDVVDQHDQPELAEETVEVVTPAPSRPPVPVLGSEGPPALAEHSSEHSLLIYLVRALPDYQTLDAYAEVVVRSLREEFRGVAVWLGRQAGEGNLVLHPPPSLDTGHLPPLNSLRESCRIRECITVRFPEGEPWRAFVVPLLHEGQAFGALAVKVAEGRGEPDAAILRKLSSLALLLTPLLVTMEQIDRLRQRRVHLDTAATEGETRLLGNSRAVTELRARIERAAMTRANVLITGETGAGKDLVAQALHTQSRRASGPFIAVNCAAIPSELFESVMFGHERGAFTGAFTHQVGLMEQAHGGTLFLDEVGDLSLPDQARILRAVETGSFRRVGAKSELAVDVRIVCATNRPLPDPSQSYFRNDLYHRLAAIVLQVPPLRERVEDIPLLAQHFLDSFWADAPHHPRAFSGDAIEVLQHHTWPGNIRELRNVVERACYEATGPVISEQDLSLSHVSVPDRLVEDVKPLDEIERKHLLGLLEKHRWKITDVARDLKVSRGTVYYKLSRLGIKLKE